MNGIKWGASGLPGAGTFTVTLNGHWAVGVTAVAAKGPDVAWGDIAGPICEEAVQLEGQKTVDPTIAQPGDVLTYTLSIKNVGTSWAYAVFITDPIPADTTYVGATAHRPRRDTFNTTRTMIRFVGRAVCRRDKRSRSLSWSGCIVTSSLAR